MKIRIGNDIKLSTILNDNGTSVDLTKISFLIPTLKIHSSVLESTDTSTNACLNGSYDYNLNNDIYTYVAAYKINVNDISIYFPATVQTVLGIYDLVILYTLSDSTYMDGTTRTYTITKESIFTLVDTSNKSDTAQDIALTIDSDIVASSITINPLINSILVNEQYNLLISFVPIHTTDRTITWSSSDSSIISVTNTGTVKALLPGSATITATTINNKTASITLISILPPTAIVINNTSTSFLIGDTTQLNYTLLPSNSNQTGVSYISSDSSVATVNSIGLVTFLKVGYVSISCYSTYDNTIRGTKLFTCTDSYMIYGYISDSILSLLDVTSDIISSNLASGKLHKSLVVSKNLLSLGTIVEGDKALVLIPSTSSLYAMKWDGLTVNVTPTVGVVSFSIPTTNMGANGDMSVIIDGIQYKIYGEIRLVSGIIYTYIFN